jgi:voltage-gated potassium channel Kch
VAAQLAALFVANGVAGKVVSLAVLVLQVPFHAYAVLLLMSYVLRDRVVTLDELFACASAYILMAILWGSAYALVLAFDPSALYINEANNPDGRLAFSELIYFSMTTLTSVGFGEITPVAPIARSLVMLQQVVGVLFVAILVARLTGLYEKQVDQRGRDQAS